MGDTHHHTTTTSVVGNHVTGQSTMNIGSQTINGQQHVVNNPPSPDSALREAVAGLLAAVRSVPELQARDEVRRDLAEVEAAAASDPITEVEVGRIRAIVARIERYPGVTTVVVGAMQAVQAALGG